MKKIQLGAVGAVAALALAACGDASADGDDNGEELTPVNVGVIPIVDVASIYLGQSEGIFEEHGIDLTLSLAQGGAAIVPAVQSGDFDFGFSNVTSLLIAENQGLPFEVVSAGPQTTGDSDNDFSAVMVGPDSDIESIADFEGQRVAVNTLNNIFDSVISEGLLDADGDPSAVDFVEIGFPDMLAQLESGNVDAISAVDPYVSIAEDQGFERVFAPFADVVDELGVGAYFTTSQMVEDDPELVESFNAAMRESQAFADENPEAVREVLGEYTEVEEDILAEIAIPSFPADVNIDSLSHVAEISERHGLIDEAMDVEEIVWDGAY